MEKRCLNNKHKPVHMAATCKRIGKCRLTKTSCKNVWNVCKIKLAYEGSQWIVVDSQMNQYFTSLLLSMECKFYSIMITEKNMN